ncbi:SDR family oxidoreductase [Corynebacterium variabile]|uniref:SDR family oxidoreductase n=1 Tax=Corynebacterium variabile TaxID=1727 RepID=UPI0026490F27|nr:SDR family oxidoreductase [Corynebacterium variabile]MDN6478386.1 SDR family oxidoreductase [Corynebacterium variabile]MDN6556115.1 SDR family oxidoreductase [Acidipropionibacterium acidipropionici]
MTIAITGATGQLGGLVIDSLLARVPATEIVALARNTEKAAGLASRGIDVRHFDYNQPEGLEPALKGVDRLLLISGNEVGRRTPQHKAVIDAAVAAGVGYIAYTSFLHVDQASIIAVAPEHKETEKLLAAAPVKVGLLRNGWYTESFIAQVQQSAETGTLLTSADAGRISAAAVIGADAVDDAVYELSGDESFTYGDLANVTAELTGRPVALQNVSEEEHLKALLAAGVPEFGAQFFASTDLAIKEGELFDEHPGTLSKLIGHPTTSLKDALAPALTQG